MIKLSFLGIMIFISFYPAALTLSQPQPRIGRALRQLATRFFIFGDTLYRSSLDGMLLLCIDRATVDRVMREVHMQEFAGHT